MSKFLKSRVVVFETEQQVSTALTQMTLYILFVGLTTFLSLSSPNAEIFFYNQSLETLFKGEKYEDLSFYERIVSESDWLLFLHEDFIRNLNAYVHKQKTEREKHAGTHQKHHYEENYVLGTPRIRQIRVQKENCRYSPMIQTTFPQCYPKYSYWNEDLSESYHGTKYLTFQDYPALPVIGTVESYKGPGYLDHLSIDPAKNEDWILQKLADHWINNGTRLVLFEVNLYNLDTLLFAIIRVFIEAIPNGAVIPGYEIEIIPMHTIWSPEHLHIVTASILFYLLVIYYTSVEVNELVDHGVSRYFSSASNCIDLTILATSYLTLTLSTQRPFMINHYVSIVTNNPYALVTLDILSFNYFYSVCVMAVCVFLVWAKLLRYISFNRTMFQFRTTLMRCTKDIVAFAVMFLIVFMAFALCGLIIFGGAVKDFNTFEHALFSMVRMVLGDFQYKKIEYTNRILCPMFYLLYVLVVTLILLNMFLAIINQTYSDVKEEITEYSSALKTFFINAYKKIVSKFTRKEQDLKSSVPAAEAVSEAGSMEEFENIQFDHVKRSRKGARRKLLRQQLLKAQRMGKNTLVDYLNEELLRIGERLDLMSDLVDPIKANLRHILQAPASRFSTYSGASRVSVVSGMSERGWLDDNADEGDEGEEHAHRHTQEDDKTRK